MITEQELIFKEAFNEEKIKKLLIDRFLPENFTPSEKELDISDLKFEKIKKVKYIGQSREEGEIPEIHFLIIEHTGTNDPRVTITRETFKIVKNFRFKNTIAVYFTKDSPNYRISLITMDIVQKSETKVKEELSNPKRYSYFLGPDSKVHTPTKNLILKGRIQSEKDLRDRFNIKVVTEEFYQELANWYFWALKHVKFPQDAEKETNGRNIALIRFITRMIFIWFMNKKGLIPDNLFDKNSLTHILKSLKDDETTYYTAILQNLFFATLNTKIEERKFRKDERYKGIADDYMDHRYYRHQALFKEPDKMKEIFSNIPFLNGGLFECLDKKKKDEDNDTGKEIRIDGFSDVKSKQPVFPNFLFFSEEETADLSSDYNDKKYKKTKVRGLINILKTYNFTVDESSPVDIEVSLDPELLGRVFENLLASYNPETSSTARKSTGSYYTPREIVDYMVEESLKQYFKTNLENEIKGLDEKINKLFSYDEEENPFTESETDKIISLINNIKVLDPAVGSGAFPMGMLQKLVFILAKLDPHNKRWKEEQIKIIEKITDTKVRQESLNKIEEYFSKNELNYGRKLYLIQNCLYGVDIQPIAIQIAKLRFFLSLLVDEKVNKNDIENNFGIEPLPNLETKLISANTLISLDKDQTLMPMPEIEELEKKLFEIRNKYFSEPDKKKKDKLRREDRKIRLSLKETATKLGSYYKHINQIVDWDPYNSNKSANWFDSEWMFGVKNGFDIVIGNPPYGIFIKDSNIFEKYKSFDSRKNSASFFIEKGKILSKFKGIICFIVPKSLTFSSGWKKSRDFIIYYNYLNTIIDVSKAFENVKLEQVIIIFKNERAEKNYYFHVGEGWDKNIKIFNEVNIKTINEIEILPIYLDRVKYFIFKKICKDSVKLGDISYTIRGLPFQKKISKEGNLFVLRGDNIGKYLIYGDIPKIYIRNIAEESKKIKIIANKKIVSQNIVAHVMKPHDKIVIMATLDSSNFLTMDTVMNTFINDNRFSYEYVLGILNSKLAEWFYYWFVYNRAIRTMHFDEFYMGKLLIKIPNKTNILIINEIETLVSKIINIKQQSKETDTNKLEKQIDNLLYKLYELTPEEIRIIEGEK